MKLVKWLMSMALMLLVMFVTSAYAESPREQLNQMVQQLQQNPSDNALREKIIKQVQAMRQVPEMPMEAKRRMGRGQAAFEMAKNPADYDNAIAEFRAASNAAPWVADIYYNLGTIYEKAGKPAEAMASFKLYLKAAPTAKDHGEVEQRIFKLEYVAELKIKEAEELKIKEAEEAAKGPAMVRIPGRNYELGKYEVTQKEWRDIMGDNPSHFTQCGDDCPVENVSWDDTQHFLAKLNQKTGKQYRLPKEAEWEVACYGGSQTEYCGGNDIDAVAWYNGNSGGQTHPVGQKQANGYGLYDMSGNVWEWMDDCWEGDCEGRVMRGGSWDSTPRNVSAVFRYWYDTSIRTIIIGFRLARTLP